MPPSHRGADRPGPPGKRPAAASHDLRLGPVSPLPALLRDLGHDPVPVLAACGLRADAFDDRERRLPYRVVACVIEHAARVSRREDFGLLLGQRFDLVGHFGLLGRLLWRAATVGEALHDLYRYSTCRTAAASRI
jgi:hypothetical protein